VLPRESSGTAETGCETGHEWRKTFRESDLERRRRLQKGLSVVTTHADGLGGRRVYTILSADQMASEPWRRAGEAGLGLSTRGGAVLSSPTQPRASEVLGIQPSLRLLGVCWWGVAQRGTGRVAGRRHRAPWDSRGTRDGRRHPHIRLGTGMCVNM